MSKLKFTVEFINKVTGAHRSAIVDLGDFSAAELDESWRGPGHGSDRFSGPVAKMVAYQHAVKTMPPDFVGLPESVRTHKVQ